MAKKKLEELQKKMGLIRREIGELEDAEMREKTLPSMRSIVGKAFVYRNNSHSCPQKKSDYWNIYCRVLELNENDGYPTFMVEELEIDSQGKAQIHTGEKFCYPKAFDVKNPWTGWESCEMKEYEKNRGDVFKEMLTLDRLRKRLNSK